MTVETDMSNPNISDEMSIFRLLENGESTRNRLCLFGKPEKDDSDILITQQFNIDRKRFISKWGFDILSNEPVKRKLKSPKKKPNKKSDDKENIDTTRNDTPIFKAAWNKENKSPESISQKNSLKMINEKSYTKIGRQPTMTDYWNYRKVSESSCSDKEN